MKEFAEACLFALSLTLIILILMFFGIITAKEGFMGVVGFAIIFGFLGTIAAILSLHSKEKKKEVYHLD